MVKLPTSQAESLPIATYRKILADVALLHERYVSSRPEPFNIFSTLRSASDEVNLHSRFLAALLDHRQPNNEARSNLKSFLESVAGVDDFDRSGVRVEREKYNIDILITNDSNQAVVIENKIWAGDQPEQLQRYHSELIARDFPDEQIHLCYLTPFGHGPSDESVGTLDSARVARIAYKDPKFQDWLRSCQQRACDQPELRESVGQYLRIVQKLTGTDVNKAHLKELTNLCLEQGHLALVNDLKAAFDEAWIQLIRNLFLEIESELTSSVNNLPEKYSAEAITEPRIRKLVTGSQNEWCGLFFRLTDHSQLGIELNTWRPSRLFYGVRCDRKVAASEHDRIKSTLSGSDRSKGMWPYLRYPNSEVNPSPRNPSRASLTLLANNSDREKFAQDVATEVKGLWQKIRDYDLVRSPQK